MHNKQRFSICKSVGIVRHKICCHFIRQYTIKLVFISFVVMSVRRVVTKGHKMAMANLGK